MTFTLPKMAFLEAVSDRRGDPMADRPAHHANNGFRNLHLDYDGKKTLWAVLKMRLSEPWAKHAERAEEVPTQSADIPAIMSPSSPYQATWIGHSTFLIQIDGVNILTDPVFSNRASPVSWAGPKRFTQPAIAIDDLPPIDFVVISHNHYDHLDVASIAEIGNKPTWMVPLGNARYLSDVGVTNVVELDWWQSHISGPLRFTATPVQHWSARGLNDRFDALWSGWAMDSGQTRVYFAGDTGYNRFDFKETGERLGPFDLAMIPIGAYAPRWFMKSMHVNPAEAVRIHNDVRSHLSLAMHWGTFPLTAEAPGDPSKALTKALEAAQVEPDRFLAIPIGASQAWSPASSMRSSK